MILMYHHVCPAGEIPGERDQSPLEGWKYVIEPEQFAWQLERLAGMGFELVSLEEYVRGAVDADGGGRRLVAVTFDDGWVDNYQYAFPVLCRLKIPATFFVVSGRMQGVAAERRMTDRMLCEMQEQGMEIGGHTRTHPNLTGLGPADLLAEVGGCKADLESVLGRRVRFFAYPGGRFNAAVVDCVKAQGFDAACSVIPAGRNRAVDRFQLSREVFSDRMDGMRDWLRLNPVGRWALRTVRRLRA